MLRLLAAVALFSLQNLDAATPHPAPLTRPTVYRRLKSLKLIDADRRLVAFHHVCDLIVASRRLPVVYVMETVPAGTGLPERGVHTTFVLNSRHTSATRIEGQTAAPLSCSGSTLIFRENVHGLDVAGQGNAIEFIGNVGAGAVSARPSAVVEKAPFPAIGAPDKPVQ